MFETLQIHTCKREKTNTIYLLFLHPNFSRKDIKVIKYFFIVLGKLDSSICLPRSRIAKEK